ncbi:MAG: RNA polymerase sigma-70 factor [Bacteroidota bacterium]
MTIYNNLPDKELTDRIKLGDRLAFSEIYKRYAETLYIYAYNILKDSDECADATQDIFIWLWQNREKLEVINLKSYLLAAVKYKLIRAIQNSKRREEILALRDPVIDIVMENELEVKELKSVISTFINDLPPKAKAIFSLSRNEYLTNREIAARLGISEKTVENQITIALKKLRITLRKKSFWSLLI